MEGVVAQWSVLSGQGSRPIQAGSLCCLKVPITPKSFFRLNKSLHLFEMHSAFLPLFNPNIDLLQAVKLQNLAIICHTAKQARGMGLFLV